MSLDPTGKGRKRWTIRWKAPLNAFQIAFEGRPPHPRHQLKPQQRGSAVKLTLLVGRRQMALFRTSRTG